MIFTIYTPDTACLRKTFFLHEQEVEAFERKASCNWLINKVMQGIFREPIGLPQLRERFLAHLLVRLQYGKGPLPHGISAHLSQALHRLAQQRIGQAARRLEMGAEAFGLPSID